MKSFNFPNMFNKTNSLIINDYYATVSNLKLLLYSDKYSLLGDPYFGTNIKRMLYNQNNSVLKDLLIDDVYDAIVKFMPQLRLSRNDIDIKQKDTDLYCIIKCVNIIDYTTNLYEINLMENEE